MRLESLHELHEELLEIAQTAQEEAVLVADSARFVSSIDHLIRSEYDVGEWQVYVLNELDVLTANMSSVHTRVAELQERAVKEGLL